MAYLTLVTGGSRSGKSTFAEKYVKGLKGKTLYIATAIGFDEEMKDRIKKHQNMRPKNWDTYEGYQSLEQVIIKKGFEYKCILLDCVTLWVSNQIFDSFGYDGYDDITQEDIDKVERKITDEVLRFVKKVRKTELKVVFVTNEVGSSIMPAYKLGRIFGDIQGRINQVLGNACDEVYFVVCGQALKIK